MRASGTSRVSTELAASERPGPAPLLARSQPPRETRASVRVSGVGPQGLDLPEGVDGLHGCTLHSHQR